MSKNIDMLIENRVELGRKYFLQNNPVMRINENFNSTIQLGTMS